MNIEEWELLPTDGGLTEFSDGNSVKKIFHEKLIREYYHPKGVFNMDCLNSRKSVDPPGSSYSKVLSQLVPMSIRLDPPITNTRDEEMIPEPEDKEEQVLLTGKAMDRDQDMVSQVFFKKMKENVFVDMKMDSPRSGSSPTHKGIIPQVDVGSFPFEVDIETLVSACSPRTKLSKQQHEVAHDDGARMEGVAWDGSKGGFNIWKWSLTGVGALCSFGVAAATICIFIIGSSHQKNRNKHQNQRIQLQLYADDKRIKEVLNEAIPAAVRGSLITTARITFGGYLEGL